MKFVVLRGNGQFVYAIADTKLAVKNMLLRDPYGATDTEAKIYSVADEETFMEAVKRIARKVAAEAQDGRASTSTTEKE